MKIQSSGSQRTTVCTFFRYLPLPNIFGLLAGLKHILCRIRSARCWLVLCLYLHISMIWSKNPFIFMTICCPSSPKDMFSSSFSQSVDTLPEFLLLPFGNERGKKFCRKLLCQKEDKGFQNSQYSMAFLLLFDLPSYILDQTLVLLFNLHITGNPLLVKDFWKKNYIRKKICCMVKNMATYTFFYNNLQKTLEL